MEGNSSMLCDNDEYDQSWERAYNKGEQLNRYPFDIIVSIVMRTFKNVKDRKAIKVLDLGCGVGNNSLFFAREGFSITGVDASKSAIHHANDRFKTENLTGDFHILDFSELDKLDTHFDLVIDRQSLSGQSFASAQKTVNMISSVLKTDGLFLSMFYNVDHSGYSECLKHAIRQENNTFVFPNKPSKSFSGSRRVTLLDASLHAKLFKNFQILEMYNHVNVSLKGNSDSDIGEYISLLKKC